MSQIFEAVDVVRAVEAVEAVYAVDALRRISPRYLPTFFSVNDQWIYHVVDDSRLCDKCRYWYTIHSFRGDHLRAKFKDLEIVNDNKIMVNVHPNCRCWLSRVFYFKEFIGEMVT